MISDESAKAANIFYPERLLPLSRISGGADRSTTCGTRIRADFFVVDNSKSSNMHSFLNPLDEFTAFYLPITFPSLPSLVVDIQWGWEAIYGAIGFLDLKNERQVYS
jgi:hypothetical protein